MVDMKEVFDRLMPKVPALLDDPANWDSLIVNRRKPATYRVFHYEEGYRICLHRFDPCHLHESFDHPHPWPGGFLLLDGSYRMRIGFSPDVICEQCKHHNDGRKAQPMAVMDEILTKWSFYQIISPFTWHSVTPLTTTYTIMMNGDPWTPDVAHTEVRTTKGKDLDKMPPDDLQAHLDIFKRLVGEYLGR